MSALHDVALSDATLVERVLAGERDAYGTLVQRHQESLYRYACGMGLDHDNALDLVQDAFVKAYARIRECRDKQHFRAWIFKIVRNLGLDYFKDIRRNSLSLSEVVDENDIAVARASAELYVTLNDALQRLPVALREAFLLKHDSGYSYEEIAELTGASESAAKMRVHRARESLRAMLMDRAVA